jgi:hypothetical protein
MIDPSQSDFMRPPNMPMAKGIREIKKLRVKVEELFVLLAKHCDHRNADGSLCLIPLDIHPETGPIICKSRNCHLI